MSLPHDEDFDGSSSLPTGWSGTGFGWSVVGAENGISPTSSPYQLRYSYSANGTYTFTWGTADTNGGNVAVTCNLQAVAGAASPGRIGVAARGSAATLYSNTTSFYAGWIDFGAGSVGISLWAGGSESVLGSLSPGLGLESGWLRATFTVNGTALSLAVQDLITGHWLHANGIWGSGQVAAVSRTNSTLSGSGYSGAYASQSAGQFYGYFDDWSISTAGTATPPPIFPVVVPAGDPTWLGLLPAPRVHLAGLPSPGVPAPAPPPALPPPRASAPVDEPAPRVHLSGALPEPERVFPILTPVRASAPVDEPGPRVAIPGPLPAHGTPPPILLMPPGPHRPALGVVEEVAPRAHAPRALPSAGSPILDFLSPPGFPVLLLGLVEDGPARTSLPCPIPSRGTPGSTGPGLLVPPTRIAHSWAAGGQLGGGGLLGAIPQYGNTSFTAPPGNGAFGDLATSGDVGPGPAGWSSNALALALPSAAPPASGGGILGLGSLGCCCGPTRVCISACSGFPVYGAVIQLLSGGVVVDSCTTDSTGCCSFTESGTYTVQVVISGSVVYAATRTLGGGTIAVAIGASSGLVCCGGYAIPKVLTGTDSAGSFAFVYDPNYGYPLWTGGHSVQGLSATVTTPNNVCLVAPASQGPVRVCYQMICHAGQDPTFSVQRSWSWVYRQGTLTPIWYQDSSGFAPGQLCITAPPPICGNPLTDTSSFAANPSSASPFVVSGTPVPARSNATADPVGGSVTLSA